MKKNYFTITGLLIIGGILLSVFSMFVTKQPERSLLLMISGTVVLAAVVQMILFKIKPNLFKDKSHG